MHRVTLCLWKSFGRKVAGNRGVRESDCAKINPEAVLVWVTQQSPLFFFNRPNKWNTGKNRDKPEIVDIFYC